MKKDEKERIIETMREKLAQTEKRIEELKQRLTQSRSDKHTAHAAPLKAMADEYQKARDQVARLRTTADETWDDAVAGLKDTWGRFETAFEKARAHLR